METHLTASRKAFPTIATSRASDHNCELGHIVGPIYESSEIRWLDGIILGRRS